MTSSDLVALVARLGAPMWKFEPVDIQSVAKDAKAAIEQLQAELDALKAEVKRLRCIRP